jgi:hypothetical protein
VNQLDIDTFVANWRYQQAEGDFESWRRGDLDQDGMTTLSDAFLFHQVLVQNGQGSLDFSLLSGEGAPNVPEASALVLSAIACLFGVALVGRKVRAAMV